MKDFQDYDPTFQRGEGRLIALNVGIGFVVCWVARDWRSVLGLIVAWGMLRTILSWLRETHRPFLARVMARGEHGTVDPVVAHYLGVFLASICGAGFGALAAALVGNLLRRLT